MPSEGVLSSRSEDKGNKEGGFKTYKGKKPHENGGVACMK